MRIDERINRAVQEAILKSGRRPVALLMGECQMDEIDDLVFPSGKTAVQSLEPLKEYMGLRLSVQPGVDGIAVVTMGQFQTGDKGRSITSALIGAHPILF